MRVCIMFTNNRELAPRCIALLLHLVKRAMLQLVAAAVFASRDSLCIHGCTSKMHQAWSDAVLLGVC